MANNFNENLIINNDESILSINNVATFLGISTATVKNWVKCGNLKSLNKDSKYLFDKKDIEIVKSRIISGDMKKLDKRANKGGADKTFIPDEYIQNADNFNELNLIVNFVRNNNIDLFLAIFLVALNLLRKEKILDLSDINDIISSKELIINNKQIKNEINLWISQIDKSKIKENFSYLLNCNIPRQRDVLGFLYQSLLVEGEKSQNGSYYTPSNIVDKIIFDYVKKGSKVFDPCCGTGQFLLSFSDVVEDPLNIYGIDIDDVAVKIARLNILLKFKDKSFTPNIFCKNTLFDIGCCDLFSFNNEGIRDFDVVATNPPWGVHFSDDNTKKLKKIYPEINSFESFSYFLKKSIDLLSENGIISFILPESILNVKTHKDIREIILKGSKIKKIVYLNRVFKNVFTPVIRLDLQKSKNKDGDVEICKESERYNIKQTRWLENNDFIFDIHVNNFDSEIIDKIYKNNHTTLLGRADWALGIVTGDNEKFITYEPKRGFEPIYKGKDVERFVLNKPVSFIQFTPEKFQQVASVDKYRAKEKLIYRFISKYLVFAYDDKQRLTLNSANIIIPRIPDYPIKVISALFNSSLYQFVFQKKFSSIKILRSHIEQLPLPIWDKKTFSEIGEMVDEIIKDKNNFIKLDNYIMDKFNLSLEEKNHINNFN